MSGKKTRKILLVVVVKSCFKFIYIIHFSTKSIYV